MELFINVILILAVLYFFTGILFAGFFLTKGVTKMDASAHGSGWGFRLIILPGTIVLWPVLLQKWMRVKKIKHDKTTP